MPTMEKCITLQLEKKVAAASNAQVQINNTNLVVENNCGSIVIPTPKETLLLPAKEKNRPKDKDRPHQPQAKQIKRNIDV